MGLLSLSIRDQYCTVTYISSKQTTKGLHFQYDFSLLCYTCCIPYIQFAIRKPLKHWQTHQTGLKCALCFQNKSLISQTWHLKKGKKAAHKRQQKSSLSRRLVFAWEERNPDTKKENRFSKSPLFLSLITLHLCFSPDIKTNLSWLTKGGGGAGLQFSPGSCNSGEDPPYDIIWISNSNLPLINTSMNASALGQIQ